MSGSIEGFIKEMQPIYSGLNEVTQGKQVSQAKLNELEGKIQAIANNQTYNPIMGEAGAKMLKVLAENVHTGQFNNLAKRVDHLSKVVSESLLVQKDPKTASAIAMKIGDTDQRDALIFKSIKALPMETAADFAAARDIANGIHNPVFKNYVIQHQILTRLFKQYEKTSDVAFLNEAWQSAKTIPHDSAQPGLGWRSEALTRLVGYMSERPNIGMKFDPEKFDPEKGGIDAFSIDTNLAPKTDETPDRFRLVVAAFQFIKAQPKETAAALQKLEDNKLYELRQYLERLKQSGDVEGTKLVDNILTQERIAEVKTGLKENRLFNALSTCLTLPEVERAKLEPEIMSKADADMKEFMKQGNLNEVLRVNSEIRSAYSDKIPDAYAQTLTQWGEAIDKALGLK